MITAEPLALSVLKSMRNRGRAVTLTVAEHGTLDEAAVEMLIDCERRGVRAVLWVSRVDELDSPLVGLATHLATDDASLLARCVERIGEERAMLVTDLRQAEARAAAERLPPGDRGPASRAEKAVRRARRTARRVVRGLWRKS
ncbi:hypothetical protein [Nesterenkonia marinintestina]|uniref:hypothetical protein n=1 Tax=Nesterenkonia marinintestina TaxID=2979865 RepID=UPI0021C22046|nr:hypothetical protein [Nesterenkonia sp. GX14115]